MTAISGALAPAPGVPAPGADRVVRQWMRRRARFLAVAGAIALAGCVLCTWFAATTSRWRSDVVDTGVQAKGEVVRITRRSRKDGLGDNVYIAVAADRPFSIVVVTDHLQYRVGDQVPVWYDPSNRRHAATPESSTANHWWTIAAAIVAVGAGLVVFGVVVSSWYLLLAVLVGRSMHETLVVLSKRGTRGRALYRRVMSFADSAAPWSSLVNEAAMRDGRVFVSGHGWWRLVWYPRSDRPFLVRRPRTTVGTWLWRRLARAEPRRRRRRR